MATVNLGELLYEYSVNITGLGEFGFSFGALMAGEAPPPPEGARFDVSFDGPSTGKLTGHVSGTDFLRIRADGRMDLHIHGVITTHDGHKISLEADGVCIPTPGSPVAELRENVRLFTSAKEYAWVNPLQIWGVGTVDLAAQIVHIKGYNAVG